jgi:hypothetical protein
MVLFNECMQSCAHIVLDTADIVRDGDFRQLPHSPLRNTRITLLSAIANPPSTF